MPERQYVYTCMPNLGGFFFGGDQLDEGLLAMKLRMYS